MMTLNRASFLSPNAALSATNLSLSKFMLAPLTTETNRFPEPSSPWFWMYFFIPATANAPAGSGIDRVSVKRHTSDQSREARLVGFLTFEDILDGGTNLVVIDQDHLIHQLITHPESLLPNNPDGGPITKKPDFR